MYVLAPFFLASLVEHGSTLLFETDAITATAKRWEIIRGQRAKLLRESDWICSITDYTVPDKDQWIMYRQELRDITKQPDLFAVVWPKAPNE